MDIRKETERMKRIIIYALAILAIFSFSVNISAAAGAKSEMGSMQATLAPDFTLKDLSGNNVTLSSFKGKKVLLVFGATWCPYCVAEIPDLNAFYNKHQDKDVKVIDVDIQESAAKVTAFAQKHNIKYTVLLDSDGKVANKYNVYGIPANFIIDENGMIKYSGPRPEDGFESLLK